MSPVESSPPVLSEGPEPEVFLFAGGEHLLAQSRDRNAGGTECRLDERAEPGVLCAMPAGQRGDAHRAGEGQEMALDHVTVVLAVGASGIPWRRMNSAVKSANSGPVSSHVSA